MKNELRSTALNAILPLLATVFPDAVNVHVSGKNMIAVDTGVTDENGKTVYATIDVTVKDNEATKTREGFDLDAAMAAYAEKQEKATERASKPKSATTTKNTEAAEKRNKRMTALREWWTNEATSGVGYTSTDIKAACADLYGELTIMQVGQDLKMLSEMMPTDCEMRFEENKKRYYKA